MLSTYASSAESSAAIEQALINHGTRMLFHRIDTARDLHQALETPDWHLVFSDLELSDFSAVDLATRLSEKGRDVPLVVIEGTGADEIALRCLESGMCQFIRCDDPYLQSLPRLVDALLRRAKKEHDRRFIERNLIESEERYLDVFDHTSDLIQCVAPDGSITYTNRAWKKIMGYTDQEVQSLNLLDVLHPDSMVCCQDRFSRLLNGETLNYLDFKFVAKSGEPVYLVGDCGSIIKEGGVISTRGIFKNNTDTVNAEKALMITEARY